MHGRLKVRTTEEERERKKKEQALKVRAYNAAMAKIQVKKQNDEYDDEMLHLTLPILQRNPDVYTLWNIRRLCVQRKSSLLLVEIDIEENDDKAQKLEANYETELILTEQCLMVQPKSYAAWHHRCWTLENSPNANWQREMQLCTKYLKLDERNFHTWDYRRYVAAKVGVSKSLELDFCTEKIKANFSNYSSWHYRSLLLPALYPYEGSAMPKRAMSEHKLKEELEMVLSAAFTDPNDSSAWFYQRWLLGNSCPALDICAFRCNRDKAVIAFTKPIKADGLKAHIFKEAECVGTINVWHNLKESNAATVWFSKFHLLSHVIFDTSYHLEINIPNSEPLKVNLKPFETSLYFMQPPNFNTNNYTKDVLIELRSQLDSCLSLLELEPDSKWTLLTTALLMRAIEPAGYHEKSLTYLQILKKVDTLRRGYYEDLAVKWILEKALTDWLKSPQIPAVLDLSNLGNLPALAFAQYFVIADEVRLTHNTFSKNENSKHVIPTFQTI